MKGAVTGQREFEFRIFPTWARASLWESAKYATMALRRDSCGWREGEICAYEGGRGVRESDGTPNDDQPTVRYWLLQQHGGSAAAFKISCAAAAKRAPAAGWR